MMKILSRRPVVELEYGACSNHLCSRRLPLPSQERSAPQQFCEMWKPAYVFESSLFDVALFRLPMLSDSVCLTVEKSQPLWLPYPHHLAKPPHPTLQVETMQQLLIETVPESSRGR